MIKIANNLSRLLHKKAEEAKYDVLSDKQVMMPAGGLLGAGVGAGLLHLFGPKEKKTLLNYLLASGAGGAAGTGLGLLGANLKDSFNFVANEKAQGNPDGNPNKALEDETNKAINTK